MEIHKRIFIVGCPRSGTTLLQGMLTAHPRIFSLPETFFFAKVLPRSRIKHYLLWPAIKVRNHLPKIIKDMGRDDLLDLAKIRVFQRDYYTPFLNVMDRMTTDAGKDVWVEKTPWHLRCIDEIQRCIPEALFIHIVRDGRDVVTSLWEATNNDPHSWAAFRSIRPKRGRTIKECVDWWNHDFQLSKLRSHEENHLIVRYESLLSSPREVAIDICRFIDVKFQENMLSPEKSYSQIVRSDEKWKGKNASGIKQSKRKYEAFFNDEERKWIEDHLAEYVI